MLLHRNMTPLIHLESRHFGQELHDGGEIGEHANMTAHALGIFRELDRNLLDIEQREPRGLRPP
jgi:hypothetical protein